MIFDSDDVDGAMGELTARWIASGEVEHPEVIRASCRLVDAVNRHHWDAIATSLAGATYVNHRWAGTPDDTVDDYLSSIRTWASLVPDIRMENAEVLTHSAMGLVGHVVLKGTSTDGVAIEVSIIHLTLLDGDHVSHTEIFDETDIDAALARFDELNRHAPLLENAATRARACVFDALNRRDLDGCLALATADARYEDRRKGLRDKGRAQPEVVRAILEATRGMRLVTEPVAVRGSRLGLTRDTYRETDDANQAIAVEHLTLTEISGDELIRNTVIFDPDDINGAIAELTARWIASGEVAHPEVIEAGRQLNEAYNRHDWDALAASEAGATYVNHRQLASADTETIVEHWSSIRALASLIPDVWIEAAEILTHSAVGLVTNIVVKGTTTEGAAIELPAITLILFDGDRVARFETFDADQRDRALARFDELSTSC